MAKARSGIYSGINAESGATGIPNNPKSLPIQPGHHVVVCDLTLDPISIGQLFWEALCLPVPQQLPPPCLGCRSTVQGRDVSGGPSLPRQRPRGCLGTSRQCGPATDPLAIGPLPPPYHGGSASISCVPTLIPDVRIANHQGKHDIQRTPSSQVANAG